MENEPLHEKICLSGFASLKKQVDLSYACADPEFPGPPPPPPWKFTRSILTFAPPPPPPPEKFGPPPL